MKVCLDTSEILPSQFEDNIRGSILYIPFRVEIDGKHYPAADWEDYAFENLCGWAKEISSKKQSAPLKFEFMDDAWELRWESTQPDGLVGQLSMVHRGNGKFLFAKAGVSFREITKAIMKGISQLILELEPHRKTKNNEPQRMIQRLTEARESLERFVPKNR